MPVDFPSCRTAQAKTNLIAFILFFKYRKFSVMIGKVFLMILQMVNFQ
jgi:hypothetical protein